MYAHIIKYIEIYCVNGTYKIYSKSYENEL